MQSLIVLLLLDTDIVVKHGALSVNIGYTSSTLPFSHFRFGENERPAK